MQRPQTTPQTTPALRLRVSSRLMHDYQAAAPLRRGSHFCSTQGADDELEFFYVAPVQGTTEKIHHVRRDTSSVSGFRADTMRHDFLPRGLAAGRDGDRVALFAVGDDRSRADIRWAERRGNGEWSPLRRLDTVGEANRGRVLRLQAVTVGDSLELFAVLEIARRSVLFRVPWRRGGEWTRLAEVAGLGVLPMTLPGGLHGVVAALPSSSSPTALDVHFFQPDGRSRSLLSRLSFDDWSSLRRADGVSTLLLYDASGQVPRLLAADGHQPTERPREIHRGLRLQALEAADAGGEPATLFLLDTEGRLSLLRAGDGRFDFDGPLPLRSGVRFLHAGRGRRGHVELILGDTEGQLRVLWHQGTGERSSWLEHQVDQPARQLRRIATYTAELSVSDERGAPWQAREVELGATRDVKIHLDGRSHWIGPQHWLRLRTSFDGRLTVVLPTDGLDTPQLRVRRPPTAGAAGLAPAVGVDPAYDARRRLKAFDVDRVRDLLPAHRRSQAAQVHGAVHAALDVAGEAAPWWPDSETPRPAVSSTAWSFEADRHGARFRRLDGAQADELFTRLGDPESGRIWDFFGDLLHAAASAVAEAVHVVFDAGRVLVRLVIDGVHWIFEGFIRLAEHAFRLVETIFHAVEVAFERLFAALAWRLEQAREDIWRTHQVLDRLLIGSCSHLAKLARDGERLAHDFFSEKKREVERDFDKLIEAVGGQRFDRDKLLAALGQGDAARDTVRRVEGMAEHQASTLWFGQKVLTASLDFEPPIGDDVIGPIRRLIEKIGGLISREFRDEVRRLESYFHDIAAHPERFAQRTVAEVLREMRALVLATLELVDDFVQAFFEVVAGVLVTIRDDVLQHPVGGFLLQAVYDLINPGEEQQELTLGRLLSMLVAFPGAILYRLLRGEAPFEQADIDALDAEMARPEVLRGLELPRPVLAHKANGFMILAGILRICPWSVIDPWLDVSSSLASGSGDGQDVDAEIDTEIDAEIDGQHEAAKPLGVINGMLGILPLIGSILTWPGGPFAPPPISGSRLEKLRTADWLCGFAAPSLGTLIASLTKFEVSPRGNPATNLVLSLVGCLQLGLGILRIVAEANEPGGELTVQRVFISGAGPVPRTIRFLGLAKGQLQPIALVALGTVDLVAHDLAGVALIVEGSTT